MRQDDKRRPTLVESRISELLGSNLNNNSSKEVGLRGQEEAKLLPLTFPMLSVPSADGFSPSRNSNTILGRNLSSIKKLI